jgi:hypothetical protein
MITNIISSKHGHTNLESGLEVLVVRVVVREGLYQATELVALQGLLEARVASFGPVVLIVNRVAHASVPPHVVEPSETGLAIRTNAVGDAAVIHAERCVHRIIAAAAMTSTMTVLVSIYSTALAAGHNEQLQWRKCSRGEHKDACVLARTWSSRVLPFADFWHNSSNRCIPRRLLRRKRSRPSDAHHQTRCTFLQILTGNMGMGFANEDIRSGRFRYIIVFVLTILTDEVHDVYNGCDGNRSADQRRQHIVNIMVQSLQNLRPAGCAPKTL